MTPQREQAELFMRLARQDEAAFRALLAASDVDFSVACFHAQQSVEKAMKAVMCQYGIVFRRTHDLEELAESLAMAGHVPPLEEDDLRRLTPYAVEFRYGEEPMALLLPEPTRRFLAETLAWADACLAGFQTDSPESAQGRVDC